MLLMRAVGGLTAILYALALGAFALAPHLTGPVVAYGVGGDIYMDDLTHRRTWTLVGHPALDTFPAWSPNGARLAFISSRDPAADYSLYVLDMTTGGVRQVAQLDGYRPQPYDPVAAPRWSPTGAHIAVPIGTGITVVDVASGDVTLHRGTFPMNHARWAPGGQELVFPETGGQRRAGDTAWRFHALAIDTGQMSEWGTHDLGCDVLVKPVALSGDGARLAYLCNGAILVYEVAAGRVTPLITDVSFPDALDWSSDGRGLVYSDFFVRDENGIRAGVVTADAATGQVRYGLHHPADKPVWMPR